MVCPVCKHDNSDDTKFCTNCNTYLDSTSHRTIDNSIENSGNNSVVSQEQKEENKNIFNSSLITGKKKTNSFYSIASIICGVIGTLGMISPFIKLVNIVSFVLSPFEKEGFFSFYFKLNGIFIIFGLLSFIFGYIHRNNYNERCTGYIIGIILLTLYIIELIIFAVLYATMM